MIEITASSQTPTFFIKEFKLRSEKQGSMGSFYIYNVYGNCGLYQVYGLNDFIDINYPSTDTVKAFIEFLKHIRKGQEMPILAFSVRETSDVNKFLNLLEENLKNDFTNYEISKEFYNYNSGNMQKYLTIQILDQPTN